MLFQNGEIEVRPSISTQRVLLGEGRSLGTGYGVPRIIAGFESFCKLFPDSGFGRNCLPGFELRNWGSFGGLFALAPDQEGAKLEGGEDERGGGAGGEIACSGGGLLEEIALLEAYAGPGLGGEGRIGAGAG